ncbi:RND family efflux transporter MFP subunit [Balneicella halophila]|uniref:RND family efflux transporter MFP subunit n=1 Tax=Balneicella halophila TaxID=1537566 RepID=A0A7L4UMS1_BALHA|nr:efflux RND transporter periplasmic adaptor subunit [Balneicella halophila]PVX49921.1 RND family efflux transporter MFP subunit [Balneicella halophila]
MKRLVYAITIVVLMASCGKERKRNSVEHLIAKQDIEGLKEKQTELQEEYNEVTAKLTEIRDALDELEGENQNPIVTTFAVVDTLFEHKIQVQGNVDTKNNTMLFPEFSGVLTNLYVKKGQRVGKGQIIAKVDDGGLSQQLGQAEVQYDLAKTTFERQERLWDKKIGSEIQYLQSKANMEAAERAVNQLKSQLSKATIRAPFAGVVDDVPVKQGSVVLPGQTPIARLVNLNDMYVRADLAETYLGKIKVGTPVLVKFPAIGEEISSKVRQVGNFINPQNRTFYIEIDIPNKGGVIKPNLMAILEIADYSNENALIVPVNVVHEDSEGRSYVYTIKNEDGKKIASKVHVTKGFTQNDYVEITEGLEKDMIVINKGSQGMQEGIEIEVKNTEDEGR